VGYNQGFTDVDKRLDPAEVVIASLGSMTHSFDENQRVVQPLITHAVSRAGEYGASVVNSMTGGSHPPGAYMLFVLGQNRATTTTTRTKLG